MTNKYHLDNEMAFHVISCHIMSYHFISYNMVSYHTISSYFVAYPHIEHREAVGEGAGVGLSIQQAYEDIRAVHQQTEQLHQAIAAVTAVKQYRYKAVFSCTDNEPLLDVQETVVESAVEPVLRAFMQQRQQQPVQPQQQPSSAEAGARAGGST